MSDEAFERSRILYALELADGTLIASGRDAEFGHVAPDERVVRYVPEDAARSSSTGWVPTSTPPTGKSRQLLVYYDNGVGDSMWWGPYNPLHSTARFWAEYPALPSDGETGGGR